LLNITQPGIEIVGFVKDKNIIKNIYEQSTIFVMPSLCEPFGLVFLEAMSYKLPCIGSTVDAMSEIIEDGITGFIVPLDDVDLLSEKIITLLNNPELCAKMGLEGYKRLKNEFTWDKLGDEIDNSLKKFLNK